MKVISFSIPIYNNAETIDLLYNGIKEKFAALPAYDFELVFTNDGSADRSLEKLLNLQRSDKRVKVINFSRNFGQIASTVASQRLASGDAIITMSADLQDPLDLIFDLISSWEKGNDIVICKRIKRNDGLVAGLTSKLLFRFLKLTTKHDMPEGGFDYYLMDKKALRYLNLIEDKTRLMHIDIFELGFKKDFIPYERLKREHGRSQYNIGRRFSIFYNTFYTYSRFPIRLMIVTGFLSFFFGILYSFSMIYSYFKFKNSIHGWTPIMILLLVSGGLIMMMLGIIGEYIWRIYDETKKRPYYIVKDVYESDPA